MVRIAKPVKYNAATVGYISSRAAVQPEQRRNDGRTGNLQYAVGAVTNAGIDKHLPAQKLLRARTEQPRGTCLYRANQRIAFAKCGFEIDVGDHVKQPDRIHLEAVDFPVQRGCVKALINIADQ